MDGQSFAHIGLHKKDAASDWLLIKRHCIGTKGYRESITKLIGLKVHKHEIILHFFLPKSNPYMPLVKFRKKFRFFSFDFRQNFEVRTFSR